MLAARRRDRGCGRRRARRSARRCGDVRTVTSSSSPSSRRSPPGSTRPRSARRSRPRSRRRSPASWNERCSALVASAHADHAEVIALLDDTTIAATTELRASLRASLHLARARACPPTAARLRPASRRRRRDRCSSGGPAGDATRSTPSCHASTRRDEEGELTRREREVAALLAEGLSNSELARRLYISPRTAAVHVSNILTKLGMSSRTEVAAWAVRNGLTAA